MTKEVTELYNQICLKENCSIELSISGGQGGLTVDAYKLKKNKLTRIESNTFYHFVEGTLIDYLVDLGATGDSLTCTLMKEGAKVTSSSNSWDFSGVGSLEDILSEKQFSEILDLTKDHSSDYLIKATASSEDSVALSELVFEFPVALPAPTQDYLKHKLIAHLAQFDFDLTYIEVTCIDAHEIFEIEGELTLQISSEELNTLFQDS